MVRGIFTITLNNQGGTGGTTTVYELYSEGWYSDSNATNKITSITKPTKNGYKFGGYYTGINGSGTQIIDANGKFVAGRESTLSENSTIYASWLTQYKVTYDYGKLSFDGSTYLDTKLSLFSRDFTSNFEVSLDIANSTATPLEYGTMFSCMDETGEPWPGFVFRSGFDTWDNHSYYEVAINSNSDIRYNDQSYPRTSIVIKRENLKAYLNDVEILSFEDLDHNFNAPLTFGAAIDGSGNPFRYFKGELSNVLVSLMYYNEAYTLPTPTMDGYTFTGWLSSRDGRIYPGGSKFTPTANTTLTAKWEKIPPVCRRATTLHTATCTNTNDYGCHAAGYYVGGSKGTTTITYGRLGTSGTLSPGDAFDCDVNGDGIYNSATERFYYVGDPFDEDWDNTKAALIYYSNVSGGTPTTTASYAYYASADENWHGPVTAREQLPTTSQWSNPGIIAPGKNKILTDWSGTFTSGGMLPGSDADHPKFDYGNKAARLLKTQEIEKMNDITLGTAEEAGGLDNYNFLFENLTQYEAGTDDH